MIITIEYAHNKVKHHNIPSEDDVYVEELYTDKPCLFVEHTTGVSIYPYHLVQAYHIEHDPETETQPSFNF